MSSVYKYIIYSILFLSSGFTCFSQNETNIWYFGQRAGLDFNSGTPEPLLNGQLSTPEGCASISDANGNLLFYSDGVTVYNSNHQIMLNGNNLNGDPSSTNSAIIVPKPNAPEVYFIFTADDDSGPNGLQYSEVDMALDNGLGGITETKNISLFTPITEQLTAVKRSSLDEYWVVTHKFGNNEFLSYRISEDGVDLNPVISAVGSEVFSAVGQIKISPNSTKLALASREAFDIQLFNFNAANGQVTNALTLSSSLIPYGVEFSPNSRFLYINTGRLYQYDLSRSTPLDIVNSQFEVTNPTTIRASLQLASDGKIYVADLNSPYLHTINEPNNLGEACDYQLQAINLGDRLSTLGLPPFIQSFFFVAGFQTDNLCASNATQFIINLSQQADSVIWDFGDGNTSTEENPTHTYSSAGTYEVTLTAALGLDTSAETQTITIFEPPTVTPVVELKQCDDDIDGLSAFNLNEVIPKITDNATSETISFYESELEAVDKTNAISNSINYINETVSFDTVWARIENANGCFETAQINLVVSTTQIPDTFELIFYQCDDGLDNSDGIATFNFSNATAEIEALFPAEQQLNITFYTNQADALAEINPILDTSNSENTASPNSQTIYVRVDSLTNNDCLGLGPHVILNVQPSPELNLTPDEVLICEGNSVELVAEQGFDSYMWSTGETTRIITVNDAGLYTVTASNIYNDELICGTDKTITVVPSDTANITEIETVDWTQNDNSITVYVDGPGDYEYSLNGFSYQDNNVFSGLNAEEYIVYVRDKNGCGVVNNAVYLLYYPRFFTPNGDGVNDVWRLINAEKEPLNSIFIYDRYGKLITQLEPNDFGWDGTYNGIKLPSSDYWFILERQNGKMYTGHFTLKR